MTGKAGVWSRPAEAGWPLLAPLKRRAPEPLENLLCASGRNQAQPHLPSGTRPRTYDLFISAPGTIRYLASSRGFGAIMTSADEYRRYAADCVRAAQSATNENSRALFLEMAQKWSELADN